MKSSELKQQEKLASYLKQRLESIPGINHVTPNTRTGGLLIEYDRSRIRTGESIDQLITLITELFPDLDIVKFLKWLAWAR